MHPVSKSQKGYLINLNRDRSWRALLAAIAVSVCTFIVAVHLRIFHNRAVTRGIRKLGARWPDDISPVEMKIEAFGLGRYMGAHLDRSEIVIPMDIIKLMSEKSGVPEEELAQAYIKGVTDSDSGRSV